MEQWPAIHTHTTYASTIVVLAHGGGQVEQLQHHASSAAEARASLQFALLCTADYKGPLQHHPCQTLQLGISYCSIKLSPAADAHPLLQPHACSALDAHLLLCLLQALCLAHAFRVELHILLHACRTGNEHWGMKCLVSCTNGPLSLHLGSKLKTAAQQCAAAPSRALHSLLQAHCTGSGVAGIARLARLICKVPADQQAPTLAAPQLCDMNA